MKSLFYTALVSLAVSRSSYSASDKDLNATQSIYVYKDASRKKVNLHKGENFDVETVSYLLVKEQGRYTLGIPQLIVVIMLQKDITILTREYTLKMDRPLSNV